MSHDVFISYAARGRDKPVADAVCAELEKHKIRCWIAPRDVPSGYSWSASIVDAINRSRVFVLVFSDNSNRSPQVLREVERAVNKGIPIVPFRIEDFTPSRDMEFFLSFTHWLDALTPPLENHLHKLAHTVRKLLDTDEPDKPAPPPEEAAGARQEDPAAGRVGTAAPRKNIRLFAGLSAAVFIVVLAAAAVFLSTRGRELGIEEITKQTLPSLAYIEATSALNPNHLSIGSGFVIDPDGLIVTNYHLMEGASTATIEINKQTYDNVTVWAYSEEWDLVILKIQASNLNALSLGKGFAFVDPGQMVVAFGNPLGMQRTVSSGIVSDVQRDIGMGFDYIQTTAPISEGSSGGPLLNMRGEVIGVNSLTMTGGQNINFAIPVDYVWRLYEGPGEVQALADVFGVKRYTWAEGDFAVILQWEGEADLNLEIWSEDFVYLGDACLLGSYPDITHGAQGEEWFVFEKHPETFLSREHDLHRDFKKGRYIVSPYYNEPAGGPGVDATLVVRFPDGRQETLLQELLFSPPFDQWFALLIDADKGTYKTLDFFYDGVLVALLEWDTSADLDLFVLDHYYEDIFTPFMFDRDVVDGREALEVFSFGITDEYNFTSGLMDIGVIIEDFQGVPVTQAILTLLYPGYTVERFRHTFTPDPKGEYCWHVIELLNMETYDYFRPEEDRLYY